MNELNKQHIDACRFCWMCRHICPIGNATGLERNTSRARALGLSLVTRGVYDMSEVIDNVYECACCGACTKECVTGWDPVMFTKAARLDAALEGKLPEYIMTLVENCLDFGNAYGAKEIGAELKDAVAAHEGITDTLFFLGVDARYKAADIAAVAVRALEKAGKSFTVLADELPSGQQLAYLIGAADETRAQMAACAKQLNQYKTVVVYDPQDASVLKREYAEWGIELTAEIVTFTAYLAQLVKSCDIKPVKVDRAAVYQDPFQLARDLSETQPARDVISAYLNLDEMLCNGKHTMWAGNILMAQWMPKVIEDVAMGRIANAKGVKANTIVTASVSEYVALKNAPQSDVEIIAIEELI
ncbi:MAG: (Fe-S)-binding protein [Clostridia bacterium]|nr:(Fe-S)-binding protein [Clostridia bacterium]